MKIMTMTLNWLGSEVGSLSIICYAYYLLGAIAFLSALVVASSLNPIYRIAFLILVFLCGSGLMILYDLYFLGLTYIIVYVGDFDCLTWYYCLLPFNAPKTRGLKRIGPHNIDLLSILFGSLLGDSYGERRHSSSFFVLHQEDSNVEYLMWFHNLLSSLGYCRQIKPKLETRIDKNRKIFFYRVRTFCFTSFNWIHELFYVNGIKVVPICIGDYLTPLALAIWIMDDGTQQGSGLSLATHGFTKSEVEFLGKVLYDKYGLFTSLHRGGKSNQYYLYIKAKSMPLLVKLVSPYMHVSMGRKLGNYND